MFTTLIHRLHYGVLAVLFFVFHLSGCIVYTYDDKTPPPPKPPEPSGTLLKSEFRIGVSPDYMPLVFKDPAYGLVGIEIDFANQLGKELGKKITFVEIPFPELIQALREDKIDIIMSGMSITEERANLVSFTDPYVTIGQMTLVRSKDSAKFRAVESFPTINAKVGFVRATTGEFAARTFFKSATLVPQSSPDDGIAALRKGEIEVFIHDAPTVWRIGTNPNEKELTGLYWLLTKEPLAWAVRKSDEPLRFTLSRTIQQWQVSGYAKQTMTRWVPMRIW
ncbi:MAG TPA: transporter substrate-binding domain-containing protein [Candidatus Binatia bacterium]|jgi:ABC-type amino acid transport substrate-binding protein